MGSIDDFMMMHWCLKRKNAVAVNCDGGTIGLEAMSYSSAPLEGVVATRIPG